MMLFSWSFNRNISEVDNSDTSSEILTVMKEEIGEDDLLKSDCHMLMFDLAPYERFTRENTL